MEEHKKNLNKLKSMPTNGAGIMATPFKKGTMSIEKNLSHEME